MQLNCGVWGLRKEPVDGFNRRVHEHADRADALIEPLRKRDSCLKRHAAALARHLDDEPGEIGQRCIGGCNIGFSSQAAKLYQQVFHGVFVLSFVSLSFPVEA